MKIHTIKSGESLSDISKMYGIQEELIRRDNKLPEDVLIVGDELIILTPTRTYLPKRGESLEGISHRFDLSRTALCTANPVFSEVGVTEQTIALRYQSAPLGSAAANGFLYKDYSQQKLSEALSCLTYLTVCSHYADEYGLHQIFNPKEPLNAAEGRGIIPLLKIFDKRKNPELENREKSENFGDMIIKAAKDGGFSGIVLDFSECAYTEGTLSAFLIELRRKMMGCDLILIIEADEDTPLGASDYCDGCILSLPFAKSFGEKTYGHADRYAREAESGKTFLELPSFALYGEGYIPIDEAKRICKRSGSEMNYESESKTLSFTDKRSGEVKLPSLLYINELLKIIKELEYMGISFDIDKTPLPFLRMYTALFKPLKNL